MLLNGLTNSLDNIIEGDTLETPAHYKVAHDPGSGVKQFDYITSNPPFKMDFSSTRNTIEQKWEDSEVRDGIKRFFAGVPKIPNKKKESMGGPVANDQAVRTVNNYLKGYFDEEIAIRLLLPQNLKDQYVFKTDKALSVLEFHEVKLV